jgi:hypothetical protein
LPFWKPLLPPTRYVLTLRSPLSVARSLEVRDGFPVQKSGQLWLDYMISALTHTAGEARLLVAYDDLLGPSAVELQRLARFLGRSVIGGEGTEGNQAAIRPDLQHHRASLQETLTDRTLPVRARLLYATLVSTLQHRQGNPTEPDRSEEAATALAGAMAEEQEPFLAENRQLRIAWEQLHMLVDGLRTELARHRVASAILERHPVWRAYRYARLTLLPTGSRREMAYVRWRRRFGVTRRDG